MKTTITTMVMLLFALMQNGFSQDQAMNYQDLQEYLPTSISGYVAGEPGGSSMNMQEMSFSSADIEFTNSDGDYIRITLLDYSSALSMYQAATAMWATGMSFEDDESIARTFQFNDNISGWEEFRKKENEAQIALGIGDSFFLTIEANNQSSTENLKGIAESMELDQLASQ